MLKKQKKTKRKRYHRQVQNNSTVYHPVNPGLQPINSVSPGSLQVFFFLLHTKCSFKGMNMQSVTRLEVTRVILITQLQESDTFPSSEFTDICCSTIQHDAPKLACGISDRCRYSLHCEHKQFIQIQHQVFLEKVTVVNKTVKSPTSCC